jgi:hypothetical protein
MNPSVLYILYSTARDERDCSLDCLQRGARFVRNQVCNLTSLKDVLEHEGRFFRVNDKITISIRTAASTPLPVLLTTGYFMARNTYAEENKNDS